MNRQTILGLLTFALSLSASRQSFAQHRVRCPQGQHESGHHHCCGAGEAWVEERSACICIEPAECRAAAAAATAAAAAANNPPVETPPPNNPPPNNPPPNNPSVVTPVATPATPPAGNCPEGMVYISAGTFSMGAPSGDGEADESPQHTVTLGAFCIDRTEVTLSQYRQCLYAGTCTTPYPTIQMSGLPPSEVPFWSTFCNGARNDRDNHPVNCVDWTQASTYCHAHNNGSLPSEAQWEYAARGSQGRRFPWGNTPPAATNLNACGAECPSVGERPGRPRWAVMFQDTDRFDTTAPVGSYPTGATPTGIMDMSGNVMEWTNDWYGPYASGLATDPTGAASGSMRVARGAAHWQSSNPATARAADRASGAPTNRLATLGFRCVAAPVAPPPPPPPPPPAEPPPTTGRHRH